jgi:hypothetical protein
MNQWHQDAFPLNNATPKHCIPPHIYSTSFIYPHIQCIPPNDQHYIANRKQGVALYDEKANLRIETVLMPIIKPLPSSISFVKC